MVGVRNYLREHIEARWYGQAGVLQLLAPLSWLYAAIAASRKQRALASLSANEVAGQPDLSVPVVVVGNIVAGGTGKTPVVIDVVQRLRRLGASPGVVARGYGGRSATWPRVVTALSDPQCCGDEAVEVASRLGCPVVVGPDRTAAARWLVEYFGCDVIVSDDGLQHYRLQRALEIAVVDAVRGQGNGYLLPVGPLREPIERLLTVDCVVKTARENELGNAVAGPAEVFALFRPISATHLLSNSTVDLAQAPFVGEHCIALSAIGNPTRFHDDLAALGCTLTTRVLADHSSYTNFVADWAKESLVVTTAKDAVKLRSLTSADSSGLTNSWLEQVWVLNRDLLLSDSHSAALDKLLRLILEPPVSQESTPITAEETTDD